MCLHLSPDTPWGFGNASRVCTGSGPGVPHVVASLAQSPLPETVIFCFFGGDCPRWGVAGSSHLGLSYGQTPPPSPFHNNDVDIGAKIARPLPLAEHTPDDLCFCYLQWTTGGGNECCKASRPAVLMMRVSRLPLRGKGGIGYSGCGVIWDGKDAAFNGKRLIAVQFL